MTVPSERLRNLPPYVFVAIGQQVRNMQQDGIDVIRVDIGSPDLPPDEFVVDALERSARQSNNHGYAGYKGTPTFREAVARYYERRFGVSLDPDTEVLPLIGSKEGIVNLSLGFLDRGDVSLVPSIGYPSYSMGALLAGADIHWIPMPKENGFLLDIDSIPEDIQSRAKLLWANYPNNPTGSVAKLDDYEYLVKYCKQHDILLASDNPYVDLTFDGYVAPSALQVKGAKDNTVEFMSLSKTYNMAGWRLGAAVGSAEALKTLLHVKSNVDSGHFKAIYDAGIAALDNTTDEWLKERNAIYQKRRDMLLDALPEIGLSADTPKGSLYIWATVNDMVAEDYASRAREEAYVSIAPGTAYGPSSAEFVRISLTVPEDRLQEAISRLKRWYTAL